jgi:hypothetical protein
MSGKRPHVMVCEAPSCGALVDKIKASTCAKAAGRSNYVVGDGCANCSAAAGTKRRKYQVKMAEALLHGKRRLIAWPNGPGASVTYLSEEEARSIAEAVLAIAVQQEEETVEQAVVVETAVVQAERRPRRRRSAVQGGSAMAWWYGGPR